MSSQISWLRCDFDKRSLPSSSGRDNLAIVTVTRSAVLAGAAILDEVDVPVFAPNALEERLVNMVGVARLLVA